MKLGRVRLLMVVLSALALLLFPVASMLKSELIMYGALLCFVLSALVLYGFFRCPHCHKFLGQSTKTVCPHCKKRL